MNYYKERRVSFEKFNSTCVKACIFCEPPPQQESVQLHECSVDEVSTRPIIKNTQEKVTGEILSDIYIYFKGETAMLFGADSVCTAKQIFYINVKVRIRSKLTKCALSPFH